MVKVHEGSFPKPQETKALLPKIWHIYPYKRVSDEYFCRESFKVQKKVKEMDENPMQTQKKQIENALFNKNKGSSGIKIPILKGRIGASKKNDEGEQIKKKPVQEKIPDLQNDICNICISNQSNIVLETCGHTSLCQDCVSRMIKKHRDKDGHPTANLTCPFCQGKAKRVLKYKRFVFENPKQKNEDNDDLKEFYGDED